MGKMKDSRRLIRRSKKLLYSFVDLLFPPCCHVCGRSTEIGRKSVICPDCFSQLTFLTPPLCKRCGCQLGAMGGPVDRHCPHCLKEQVSFTSARSLLSYRSPVPEILHRLKYRADSSVIEPIKVILEHNHKIWKQNKCDLIIPVPLHVKRLRQRGMNQAQLLARTAFPDYRNKIEINLLVRVKNTTSQTGLNGVERRRNLKDAFCVTRPEMVENRSVWLVDDVFTTGTTVSECSKILKKNGASDVHVWTFARA